MVKRKQNFYKNIEKDLYLGTTFEGGLQYRVWLCSKDFDATKVDIFYRVVVLKEVGDYRDDPIERDFDEFVELKIHTETKKLSPKSRSEEYLQSDNALSKDALFALCEELLKHFRTKDDPKQYVADELARVFSQWFMPSHAGVEFVLNEAMPDAEVPEIVMLEEPLLTGFYACVFQNGTNDEIWADFRSWLAASSMKELAFGSYPKSGESAGYTTTMLVPLDEPLEDKLVKIQNAFLGIRHKAHSPKPGRQNP